MRLAKLNGLRVLQDQASVIMRAQQELRNLLLTDEGTALGLVELIESDYGYFRKKTPKGLRFEALLDKIGEIPDAILEMIETA
jgi:hypothetical protein